LHTVLGQFVPSTHPVHVPGTPGELPAHSWPWVQSTSELQLFWHMPPVKPWHCSWSWQSRGDKQWSAGFSVQRPLLLLQKPVWQSVPSTQGKTVWTQWPEVPPPQVYDGSLQSLFCPQVKGWQLPRIPDAPTQVALKPQLASVLQFALVTSCAVETWKSL
jgi:hypothetical protein